MFCPQCGAAIPEGPPTCGQCGWRDFQGAVGGYAATYPPAAPIENDPAMRMLIPVGRSVWAIAAGYLGLVSVIFLPAPLALICGIVALRDIKKHPEKGGKGRAIFGIVMGGIFSALFLFFIGVALIEAFANN